MLAAVAAAAEVARDSPAKTGDGSSDQSAVMPAVLGGGGTDSADAMGIEPSPFKLKQQVGYDDTPSRGVQPASEVGRMDHLLTQMVAEQQQVEREQQFRERLAAAAVAKVSRLNRPKQHFITMALNGESSVAFSVCTTLT